MNEPERRTGVRATARGQAVAMAGGVRRGVLGGDTAGATRRGVHVEGVSQPSRITLTPRRGSRHVAQPPSVSYPNSQSDCPDGTDLYARCHAKASDALAEYHPEPLPDDVAKRIRAIVEVTDRPAGVG